MLVVGLLNILFGMGFALAARERLRADGPFAAPAFALVGLHAGAIVAPIAFYFYVVHPSWSWMYWIEPRKISAVAGLPLMVGHAALVMLAWYVSAFVVRRGMVRGLAYACGVLLVATLVTTFVLSNRLFTAADFIGFTANKGSSAFNVVLGWAFLVATLAMTVSAVYVAIELLRDGRRVRSR